MSQEDVEVALRCQLDMARDNLHKARAAWRHGADMSAQYGESGRTRNEIITGYVNEVARWEVAPVELKRKFGK